MMAATSSDFTFSGEHAYARGQEFMIRARKLSQVSGYNRLGRANTIRGRVKSPQDEAKCEGTLRTIYNKVERWTPPKK